MGVLYDEGLGVLYDEGGLVLYDEGGPPQPTPGPVQGRLVFAVGPGNGNAPVQEVTEFSGATFKRNLKSGPELQFTMSSGSPAALLTSGLATDVWVFKNGGLWLRCRTMPIDQVWGENGEDEATVNAVGYKRVVESRQIISGPPTYVQTDQGAIIWALIQHTQAQTGGNLGIGAGTYLTGQLRDRNEYQIGDNFGKILGDLNDVINGVWWDIDASKLLQAKLLSAFPVRTDPIVWGKNARSMKRARGKGFANVAGAIGSKLQTVVDWQVDAGVATDPRGRWEAFDASHSSAIDQARVVEYSTGLLAERLHTPSVWTMVLEPAAYFEGGSDYSEGEFVNIVVPVSAVDEVGQAVNVMAQVTEITVTLDDAGAVSVQATAVETG